MKIHQLVVGALGTNCYLVQDEITKKTAIIDPGDEKETIASAIQKEGLVPSVILLTHGHMDHMLAAVPLKKQYGCDIAFHEKEIDYLRSQEVRHSFYDHDLFEELIAETSVLLQNGDTIKVDSLELQAIEVPGHTSHSLCYYAKQDQVLFAGDTLFCGSIGRTDFYAGSSTDLIIQIRDQILVLPDEVRVLPGHGPGTTIGAERKNNPFLGGWQYDW